MACGLASPPGIITAACLLVISAGTAAQEFAGAALDPTVRAAGLRVDKAMLAGPMADAPIRISAEQTAVAVQRTEVSLVGSAVVLEMGRMTADGKFVRPRLTIGRQSHELRTWMSSMGIPAERCMLPTFRGRLKRNEEGGNVGAAVLVSARCSFY